MLTSASRLKLTGEVTPLKFQRPESKTFRSKVAEMAQEIVFEVISGHFFLNKGPGLVPEMKVGLGLTRIPAGELRKVVILEPFGGHTDSVGKLIQNGRKSRQA